jgi:hypothetical protein
MAQVSTNAPVQSQTAASKQQDRRRLMKILGLTSQELKGLTQEERRSKVKEATNQKIIELQQKQTAGTITADEKSDLAFLESRQKHGKGKSANAN